MTSIPPAFDRFTRDMRTLCAECRGAEGRSEEAQWSAAADLLHGLLIDTDMRARAEDWPVCSDGPQHRNLVFYEDADYGFTLSAYVKGPLQQTPVHEHGPVWTLYGLVLGGERVVQYDRFDDQSVPDRADVRERKSFGIAPGEVDIVPPHAIHAEFNGDARTVALILRSGALGAPRQHRFYPGKGTCETSSGPTQEVFSL